MQNINPFFFILLATILEASGDAIVRMGIHNHVGMMRLGLFAVGAVLLFGYGLSLNLAPAEFGQIVGLYISTLFVVFQITNYIAFKTVPTLPVIVGGAMIVSGGLIVMYWKR